MITANVIAGGLALFIVIASVFRSAPVTETSSSQTFTPLYSQGKVALQRWLKQSPQPLPHSTIVSTDGVQGVGNGDYIVSFLVESGNTLYKASLEINQSGQQYTLLANPSVAVSQSVIGAPAPSSSPWPGIAVGTTPPSASFNQAITGWANAFTSGSSSALSLTVGDPNSSVHFTPLSGIAQVVATTVSYAPMNKQNTVGIARVNLAITWDGEPTSSNPVANYTFDVLVDRPLSAAPVVVAWGPPGSGPSLVPYQNAVRN